jgi:two-component system, sporulation sensor kinase A
MSSSLNDLGALANVQHFSKSNQANPPRRALIIDDEEVVCQIVDSFLKSDGWEVSAAEGIEDASLLIRMCPFPVIICDVHLPGDTSGLIRTAREADPFVQIIMYTGDPTITSVREALQQGAYDYLQKPCSRENLVHVVNQAFEKYQLLSDQSRLQAENEVYRRKLEELVARRTEQLRETELKYRTLFDCAVDAIFLLEIPSGVISDFNPQAARFLRVKGVDLTNRSIRDFVLDQLDAPLKEAQNKEGHAEWRFENIAVTTGDGQERHAQISAGIIDFDDRLYLQVVARDVTHQMELRQRHEAMESELLNGQRLSTIGQLAAGVAHNINTPLMGIYGVAQLLKMKYPQLTDMDSVLQQVERINEIIRNLMWKSRQEQDQSFQEIDLCQLLKEELRFLEADLEFKHNVEKVYDLSDEIPAIMGKYSDFSQSLTNIIRNALDSMFSREDKIITVKSEVANDEIIITIKDTGCGIPAEDMDKIFLPYYTTKPLIRDYEEDPDMPIGNGLGLSTVQKLLAPYGVKYKIDSTPNLGTSFAIHIPLTLNSASARRHRSEED